MATVDLMGGDAQRIRNQYKTSLQRDASDDEVSGWLSGSYGGGGVDQWANQIAQSDEAKQRGTYKPPSTNPGGAPEQSGTDKPTAPNAYQDMNYWGGQNVNPGDMFDANGQMKPGWSRTGQGYERTGNGGTGWDANPGGNYQNWFLQNTGSTPPSGRALEAMAPQLAKQGIKLGARNAQGMIDTIILPDGSAWDVIESATMDGGKRWQWIPAGGSGGNVTSGNTGVGGGRLPGNQYSDPYTQMLEELIKSRIGTLQQPYDDGMRQQYGQGLQNRANSLGQANTQVTQLMDYLQKRFGELQTPGYTGAENEAIRTGALDPIETDRQAARKRVTERLAARGLNPDSGIFQQALMEVDKQFDAIRGVTQNTLVTNDLARRDDRQQRAERIGGQLVDIPDARAREQLDVFQALEMLSQVARDEDGARSREAIGYAGSLNDLTMQRLQAALQAAGMGGNPASLLSGLTGIAGLNQSAAALNRANSQSKWAGLGNIMAILASGR